MRFAELWSFVSRKIGRSADVLLPRFPYDGLCILLSGQSRQDNPSSPPGLAHFSWPLILIDSPGDLQAHVLSPPPTIPDPVVLSIASGGPVLVGTKLSYIRPEAGRAVRFSTRLPIVTIVVWDGLAPTAVGISRIEGSGVYRHLPARLVRVTADPATTRVRPALFGRSDSL